MPDSFMVSGVFGMFFIHRKRTASLPLSETAPFLCVVLEWTSLAFIKPYAFQLAYYAV